MSSFMTIIDELLNTYFVNISSNLKSVIVYFSNSKYYESNCKIKETFFINHEN